MFRPVFLYFAFLAQLVSAFHSGGVAFQKPSSLNIIQEHSSVCTQRLNFGSLIIKQNWRSDTKKRAMFGVGRHGLFAKPVLEHQDIAVLETQIPDEPVPSSQRAMGIKGIIDHIRAEGMPWLVTAILALGMCQLASSIIPLLVVGVWELFFLAFTTVRAQEMNKPPVPEPVRRDLYELWSNCLDTVGEEPAEFLSGWFYDAPVDSIRLEDMHDFIAWATFSATFEKLAAQQKVKVEAVVQLFEEKLNMAFSPRAADEAPVPSMRFTIEPMQYAHKPSIFYFATNTVLGSLGRVKLFNAGFTRHRCGVFKYWVRVPVSEEGKQRLPIVFFHGIGVGIVMYLQLIDKLLVNDCPIICVDLPFISTKLVQPPTIDEQLSSMQAILDRWDIDKALFMGHSYGSVMLSWMLQHMPARVAGLVFIDPIVLMLNLKNTLYNFLYRQGDANKISYLVGTELFVNYALRRNFWWYNKIVWAQDMHAANIRSLVCLSDQDEIVPSQAVEQHIAKFNAAVGGGNSLVRSYMMTDAHHGAVLFDSDMALRLAARCSDFWEVCDETAVRVRRPLREPPTLKNLFGLQWFVTQGRWRLRKLGRPLTQFLAARGVGASFGW
mmetsp:Transcript_63000/g.130931  ORF Transcript_63000/g.130931 Transcript_63000/m.130931 type:complete len:606 (+) Transcript_63000:154-1971(+)